MKISTYDNRTAVTFNISGVGGELVEKINKIHEIIKRHNPQDMLFENKSPWRYDQEGKLIGTQLGDTGGTITFHSHSCNHVEAANELVEHLKTIGLSPRYFREVVKTHKKDGSPYKVPQSFTEEIK